MRLNRSGWLKYCGLCEWMLRCPSMCFCGRMTACCFSQKTGVLKSIIAVGWPHAVDRRWFYNKTSHFIRYCGRMTACGFTAEVSLQQRVVSWKPKHVPTPQTFSPPNIQPYSKKHWSAVYKCLCTFYLMLRWPHAVLPQIEHIFCCIWHSKSASASHCTGRSAFQVKARARHRPFETF